MPTGLWGLDCTNENCVHDTVRAYRLQFFIRRNKLCVQCQREGVTFFPDLNPAASLKEDGKGWLQCVPCRRQWRTTFSKERPDLTFRLHQYESAQAQIANMGVDGAITARSKPYIIEDPRWLPFGHDARMLMFNEEPMRRSALYFRERPTAGDAIEWESVLQCRFAPGSTASQRRVAAEHLLPKETLSIILQRGIGGSGGVGIESSTLIRCHHCREPLPLKALSTLTLREIEKGD